MNENIKTETFELDEKALGSIADAVVKGVSPVIEKQVNEAVNAKFEATEKVISKNVHENEKADDSEQVEESKELGLMKAAMALVRGDLNSVKKYNTKVLATRQKAGYANTSVNADGNYVVLLPEFEAEIEKISPNYGVAFSEATVRTISGNSIKTNKRGSNVTMYETAQAGVKTGTKLTISQVEVALRKFAAIAPVTDELSDDAAIDFWNELRDGFAEERGRIADTLVFTENGTTYKGVLRASGTFVEPVGATLTSVTWDDLMNAESKVPTNAAKNGKWYMHRTVWNIVRQAKDSEGRYQALPNGALITPWGTPVVLVDAMPASTDVDSDGNTPFAVFGDLKRIKLYVKRGLVLDILSEGTVHDAENSAINLGEQDMKALRAVTRMVALIKFPEAFCVLGTGTVS